MLWILNRKGIKKYNNLILKFLIFRIFLDVNIFVCYYAIVNGNDNIYMGT